jgi:Holliday junction DNA helicase RuvA
VAVIEVGGVGFSVQVTPDHARSLRLSEEALVVTSLIVREDALTLFGFADTERLEVFELLLSVTGVGPKSALGVLAALTPAEIAAAVADEDDRVFRKVSGIGPKTAKLIVVSLAGKLIASASPQAPAPGGANQAVGDAVLTALIGLGWPERVAAGVVEEVRVQNPDETAVPALLRLALAQLGPAATQQRQQA